jgi:hypothetical protein
MMNSYLRLKRDEVTRQFHPVIKGLEEAYKIINTIYSVQVKPNVNFPGPVTLIPSYPNLPMEDVYPREEETTTRQLYLREVGKGHIAYFPGDLDRSFWQIMSPDHSQLLRNTINWALNEEPIVDVQTEGIIDVTVWRQKNSMTVHLVNLTNPMMMKGPFKTLFPVDVKVRIKIPAGKKVTGVNLLMNGSKPIAENKDGAITLSMFKVTDHEIIALDLV